MFARVIYGDSNEMIINPNCYIRLIYEYIRIKAQVPDEVEIDLCDGRGILKKINEPPTYKSGLELLELGETYYLCSLKPEKKGKLVPVPLIDSSTALYEALVKRLESNKMSVKALKINSNQQTVCISRHSKQIDTVVVNDIIKKKKKKKEVKPIKSNRFPSFIDHATKSDLSFIPPLKDHYHDGRKIYNDGKQIKYSKTNGTFLPNIKSIWYLNPSLNFVKENNLQSGKANLN